MSYPEREFESALEAVYPALVRSASVLCWSGADIEDVVQETVLQAWRSYSSFRGRSSMLTWCYAILARVSAAANRQRLKKLPADYATGRTDQLPPVDAAVLEGELARAVIDAIRALPQRQREVVTLHFLEELSYAEIAEALDIAIGTVKATIFAAKMSLRQALATTIPD